MNLRDLHYLTTVAELRHFGRAAEACHVSQPTLSMQIKKLEETLGVRLFERSNKQVILTPSGVLMVERARRILQEVAAMKQIAEGARDPFAGEFRLGAFPTLAPYFLPTIVPALHAAMPNLTLLLTEEKTPEILSLLAAGSMDAAFLALPVEEAGLESAPLFEEPFLLAVPATHPLARKKHVYLQDLAALPLLLLEDGHCLRDQALDVCRLAGASEQREFRATSMETLRQMIAAGVGVTLMPAMAARADANVRYMPFKSDAPTRRIGLVWRASHPRKTVMMKISELARSSSRVF